MNLQTHRLIFDKSRGCMKDLQKAGLGEDASKLIASLASKAKAFGLTKPDGSAYTQADMENAMRNSGKDSELITQGMQVDPNNPNAITDKGAIWNSSDAITLVQVNRNGSSLNPDTTDPKLAAYIVEQTGGANTPYRDLYNRVQTANVGPATNPNAGLNTITPNTKGAVTPEAAAGFSPVRNPVRDVNDTRNDVADGAAVVGRGSDITAATSTMAAAVPGPHQPGAAATVLIATGVGFAANVVEQAARPDMTSSAENAFYMAIQMGADSAFPIAAPITNEVINAWKNSNTNLKLKDWAAVEWRKFVDSRSKP